MDAVEIYRTMARYNRWMNEKVYAACAEISDEERKRDRGAPFRSMHGTLNHILLADRLWMGRYFNKPYPARTLADELYADFDELRRERVKTDEVIENWAQSLTPEIMDGRLRYISLVNPEPRDLPMWLFAQHLFNHSTHHRGQLTTMLEPFGVDYSPTDLIAMPPV